MANLLSYYVRVKKRQTDGSHSQSPLWLRLLFPLIGLAALIWFLIRVTPKPSRATYPCQRIAFPLASGFVIWLMGLVGAMAFLRRGRRLLAGQKRLASAFFIFAGVLCLWLAMTTTSNRPALAETPVANHPIGVARGLFPGRVVWVHDPNATDWDGPYSGDGYSWQPVNTSQKHVDAMVGKAIRQLTGCVTDATAWDALFRHFNIERGKGDIGYSPGEKITIKVNLTTCNHTMTGWTTNRETYNKVYYLDKSDTSPQLMVSLLRQLVFKAGIEPNDIAIGDTLALFPNQWWDLCHSEFPNVTYFDYFGEQGRVQSVPSGIRQHWSHGLDPNDYAEDFIPALYAEAEYLINLPVLKSHNGGGITQCAKNHYGSYNRTPDNEDYYSLHDSLASHNPDPNSYRALVDIMGHPHMGGKTLLYLVDGLYGGYDWRGDPCLFEHAPFDNDWPSSILASQDPVAIDAVGLDILWEQWDMVQIPASDDYLKEAALADNPPSGTFYDPDGDGQRLESLGVYERWNNAADRQYSRNLDPISGTGIELVYVRMKTHPGDLSSDGIVETIDLIQLADQWLWMGAAGQIREDLVEDGVVNMEDFRVLSSGWQTSD